MNCEKPHTIGIDLGTTNSCVAVLRHGKVEVIGNEQGYYVTPSYVAFNNVERLVGDAAKEQARINPENTIFDAKRLIGRTFKDPVVQEDLKNWPFVVQNIDSEPRYEINEKNEKKLFAPEEISAMLLEKMRKIAESYLNETITDVVITVPAYFNNAQRNATYDAAKIAGLNVLKLLNEPTAAAVSYAYNHFKTLKPNTKLLVYDLGGGTFDVSILNVGDDKIDVLATNGDTHLGGDDFDNHLIDYCIQNFQSKYAKDIRGNNRALQRLRTACEKAKRELSTAMDTTITLEYLHEGIDFSIRITRARFDEMNLDYFRKTLVPIEKTLDDTKLSKNEIDILILVGGSARIPKIQSILVEFFDGKTIDKSIDFDHAVAHGAAIQAAMLSGDVSEKIFGYILRDVTPLSLGLRVINSSKSELYRVLIPRNTIIPIRISKVFFNACDNQKCITFNILQGENEKWENNHELAKFYLDNCPLGPRLSIKINVIFEIDANGILNVIAEELSTGLCNGVIINDVCGKLRTEQIDKMISEAEKYRRNEISRTNTLRARDELENQCIKIMNEINNNGVIGVKENLIKKQCADTLTWLENNAQENQKAYEERSAELKTVLGHLSENKN